MASPSEEKRNPVETPTVKEMMHKIKTIQFFGRDTPIILQNDNGPCPLLAICNILSLRNSLSSDVAEVTEVSQEKLLSLVAERLIDSNSNVDNKDAGYVENQQQNIADAIDLLPRLATGIDVNIKFTRIDDFEFTRECAIFDLLDIPLYHGWIFDPQDTDTSSAIGSKSYNTLMGELVALDTRNMESVCKKNSEQDCIELTKTAGSTSTNDTTDETLSKNANSDNSTLINNHIDDLITFETGPEQDVISSLEADKESHDGQMSASVLENSESKDKIEKSSTEELAKTDNISLSLSGPDSSPSADQSTLKDDVTKVEKINVGEHISHESCSNAVVDQPVVESSSLTSTADGSEPVFGEQSNLETSTIRNEGEAVISEQVDKDSISADDTKARDETAAKHGELIRSFLKNSASQLTIYGLFSLQEGLKERELCVFFRNNHFNTMFKFEDELYILATDQGYINQPDLVWEKLNEVNGDTVFMNSNFKKFNAENNETRTWNEQNAMTNTADYLASIDNPAPGETGFNSDLQLAIALQQQEFEQQQQQQQQQQLPPQHVLPQSPTTSRSGLVVGPKNVHPSRPRNSSTSSRQESKPSKDKCTIM